MSSGGEAEWYIARGERITGPMTLEEVFEKISAGEISWAHFAFKQGQSNWRRLCDIEAFQDAVPKSPPKEKPVIRKVEKKRSPPPAPTQERPEQRIWFLYYSKSQFGPFAREEMDRFLRIGKIHGRVHAWKDGMEGWTKIEKLAEFSDALAEGQKARAGKQPPAAPKEDQREAPRRPLVARLLLTDNQTVIAAVCRDVSVGGMQVLTDQIPGDPGTVIKLNVSPSGKTQDKNFKPFVAEGEIVRILEDGRGFSFRFKTLSEEAKKGIERYIAET